MTGVLYRFDGLLCAYVSERGDGSDHGGVASNANKGHITGIVPGCRKKGNRFEHEVFLASVPRPIGVRSTVQFAPSITVTLLA